MTGLPDMTDVLRWKVEATKKQKKTTKNQREERKEKHFISMKRKFTRWKASARLTGKRK